MHIYLDSPANPTCTIRRWRFAAIALGMVAALFAFSAVASSTATYDTVPVAHAPISASSTVPPNIMLVLDDSGSMLWDYMPDWKYLASRDENDVINANDNGLYYNPAITYLSPPRADSTAGRPHRYKNQTDITHVPNDGFAADVGHTLDYSTPLHEEDLTSYLGEDNYQSQHLDFSVEIRAMDPDGPKAKHPVHGCNKWKSRKVCHYFQYATGPVFHSKIHYVASPAQGCMDLNASTTPTCVTASTMGNGTNGAPAGVTVGQNIANWFAYYHTRLLTAKSSMMLAFAHMDKAYRFGYISIGTYPSSTVGLAPFGDGIGGSRKDEFWKWIANMATGNQGTPLRGALNFVGQFYMGDAPWKTMSSDPDVAKKHSEKMLTCRQSYVILTTDGFWQGDSPLRSGDNEDGSEGPTIKGPNGQSYTYHPRPPYSDPYSDTLADVAMKYWKTDLRPGMANEVPTSVADPAFWQHMVTFTIGFGFTPHDAADKPIPMDQVFSWARGETGAIKNFRWPKPAKNSINNIADLAHAAVNGHGGFYSASNPEKITVKNTCQLR